MKINVTLEGRPGNWAAYSDHAILNGIVSATGDTRDEAIEKFRSMLPDHMAYLKEQGRDVPSITELEFRELVSI